MKELIYRCDSCRKALDPDKGFTFAGNVHALGGGGFIGNSLLTIKALLEPEREEEIDQLVREEARMGTSRVELDEEVFARKLVVAREFHYCVTCTLKTLAEAARDMGCEKDVLTFLQMTKPAGVR